MDPEGKKFGKGMASTSRSPSIESEFVEGKDKRQGMASTSRSPSIESEFVEGKDKRQGREMRSRSKKNVPSQVALPSLDGLDLNEKHKLYIDPAELEEFFGVDRDEMLLEDSKPMPMFYGEISLEEVQRRFDYQMKTFKNCVV